MAAPPAAAVATGTILRSGRVIPSTAPAPQAVVGANQSYNIHNVPAPLGSKKISRCTIEFLDLGPLLTINHVHMKLEFQNIIVEASCRAPANTRGVILDFALRPPTPMCPTPGDLIIRTYTYAGSHIRETHSIDVPVHGTRYLRDFLYVPLGTGLLPSDFHPMPPIAVGCRDWMSQFIRQLTRGTHRRLDLLAAPGGAHAIFQQFNFFYPGGANMGNPVASRVESAVWNFLYHPIPIPAIRYAP